MKENLSECLLLAAVAEVPPVRTVALPNLIVVQVVHRPCTCLLVFFRLLLITLALIEND